MEELMREEFENGQIWEEDIESANEMVADYIRSVNGDDEVIEYVLSRIHHVGKLTDWDYDRIAQEVLDYMR